MSYYQIIINDFALLSDGVLGNSRQPNLPSTVFHFYPGRFRLRQSRYKSPLGVYWCLIKSRDEDNPKRILGKVVE